MANLVSITDAVAVNNMLDIISGIVGNAPPTTNTLGKLANATNKDPQLYNALVAMKTATFPSSGMVNCYTKQAIQQVVPKLDRQRPRDS